MKFGIRAKLFVAYVVAILAVGLPSGFFVEAKLRVRIVDQVEIDLSERTAVARDMFTRLVEQTKAPHDQIGIFDSIADQLGESMNSRVSVMADDGLLLGDSQLTLAELATAENHGTRPEVIQARANELGVARRFSTTVHQSLLYVARRFEHGGYILYVRVARPLSEVDDGVEALRLILVVAGGVAGLLATGAGFFVSHILTKRLIHLVARARRIAKGASGVRLDVPSSDELGRLAGTFNRMAGELERAVRGLSSERDRLQTILDSMEEGVVALDDSGQVTLINGAARRLFGGTVLDLPALSAKDQERHGEPPSMVEFARVPELLEMTRGANPEPQNRELKIPSRGHTANSPRLVQVHSAPLQLSGGRVLVMRDITVTRQLEQVRSDFVANVSHELRTPVSVVRANAETLLDGALDDKKFARRFVDAIYRHAERLTAIIEDLLDLSRLEAGSYAFQLSAVALTGPVRRACDTVRSRAESSEITVTVQVPDDLFCRADRDACEHVVVNLVENAVKYTQHGGSVAVLVRLVDGNVRLEVRDNGPGIPLKHRARVFERFYRVDPGRSREMGGTGLGLSIVKHLVEGMEGKVGLECPASGGSVFWFELPHSVGGDGSPST